MDPRDCVLLVLIPACVASCAAERRDTACLPLSEGVRIVSNDGPGAWEAEGLTPRFEERWRRGGAREGEELSLPITVVPAKDGRIAVPDLALADVSVVHADGTWRGVWTRSGDGPGETRNPMAVAWRGDGVLMVFDIGADRVVALEEGRPVAADVAIEPGFAGPSVARGELQDILMQSSAIFLMTRQEAPGAATRDEVQGLALRFDLSSGRVDTLSAAIYPTFTAPGYPALRAPGWPYPLSAANDERAVVAASDGSYRVLILDAEGRATHQICRVADPLPLAESELGGEATEEQAALVEGAANAIRPSVNAAIGDLVMTSDGGLWVQRERWGYFGTPNESFQGVPGATYDVFDAAGRFRGTLKAPADARIQAVTGDTVWAFEVGDLDETWIVQYRLEGSRTNTGTPAARGTDGRTGARMARPALVQR